MQYLISSLTDRGLEREQNEDNCAYASVSGKDSLQWHMGTDDSQGQYQPLSAPGLLAIVADGMGGRNAGEVASQLLIDSFQQSCTHEQLTAVAQQADQQAIHQFLSQAVAQAHTSILDCLEAHPEHLGMGTTLVSAWLTSDQLHLAWCGDCRAYQFTLQQGLQLLSHDHSYVQQLVDEKKITPEEAFNHPDSNLVTRGIGDVDVDNDPETRSLPLQPNSLLLLCSDGISGYLRDQEISAILSRHFTSPAQCNQALLQAAYEAGGGDNITAIVLSLIPDGATGPQVPFLYRLKRCFGK